MKTSRIIPAIIILFTLSAAFSPPASSGWEDDIDYLLSDKKDYAAAFRLLESTLDTVDRRNRPFVVLAMAYCAGKQQDKQLEEKWLITFFETYKGLTDPFPLKNANVKKSIGDYLRQWRRHYPLIRRWGLVKDHYFHHSILPPRLTLGIEINHSVLYRLLNQKKIVAGGQLQEGFNFVGIPTDHLFEESGKHTYTLELKANNITIKKTMDITILCDRPENSGEVKESVREAGYGLAMFIENRMVAYHKKKVRLPKQKSALERHREQYRVQQMNRGGPNPFDPLGNEAAKRMSLPVLALPVLAYKYVVKPNLKKKEKKVKTWDRLSGTFLIKNHQGVDSPLIVVITID